MVVSQDLLMQVRYRLRDNGEPQTPGYIAINNLNNKPDKGHFWSDRLIYLVLNEAQNIIYNQALVMKDEVLLNGLFSSMTINGVTPMPTNFGWYIGGVSYPAGQLDEKIARIYIGGESEMYRHVKHYALYLIGSFISSRWNTTYPADGRLDYWRRPTSISGANINLFDFEDSIYNDWIVTQACVLLGMMEVQTAREYKNYAISKQKFMINPKKFVNYIENREQIGGDYGAKDGKESKNDSGSNG